MYLGDDGVLLEQRGNVLRPRSKVERLHEALIPLPLGTGHVLCRAVTACRHRSQKVAAGTKVGKSIRVCFRTINTYYKGLDVMFSNDIQAAV